MNKVKTYISKPIEVEAVQFIVGSESPATEFLGLAYEDEIDNSMVWKNNNAKFELFQPEASYLEVYTKDGTVIAKNRDYIIKDRMGFYNVIREDLFLKYYYEK